MITDTELLQIKTSLFALGLMAVFALAFLASNSTYAEEEGFVVCPKQTYALCALTECVTLDDVAYCKCEIKHGNSVSLPYNHDGKNICNLNQEGSSNGFMVSTFSLREDIQNGTNAIYVCPILRGTITAQCDGGLCFTSTQNSVFPGLGQIKADEIICSCPYDPPPAFETKYWALGPASCSKKNWIRSCAPQPRLTMTNYSTGAKLEVTGPPTTNQIMLKKLYGKEYDKIMEKVKFCGPKGQMSAKQALGND